MTASSRTTADETHRPSQAVPAWKVILKMVQYRPRLWLGNLMSMLLLMVVFQVPGLVMRAFLTCSPATHR